MSMADRDGWIWHDGKLVPWRDATTHVLTHTLHYGMGVFEGVRCYKTAAGPAIFRLRDHTDRLFRSARILGLKIPYPRRELDHAHRSCVAGDNVFMVRDGKLHTPDLSGGALAGITRATIIEFAGELGIPVVERRITRDEFYVCDEAFFTGTAAEVTPIREMDHRPIGDGKR